MTTTFQRFSVFFACGPLVAAITASPAFAISSNLNGNAVAGNQAGVFQSFMDVPVATLSGVQQQDAMGNDAITSGFIATPAGELAIASHACSGGVPPALGSASGAANAGADLLYTVTSSTLSPGTPVEVLIQWSMVGRVTVVGDNLMNVQDVAQTSLNGQVSISINNVNVTNRNGGYSRRVTLFDGYQFIASGNLNVTQTTDSQTHTVLVGQTIRFLVQTGIGAGTFAFGPAVTDADSQAALVWGMTSTNPQASVVLMENHAELAPPASNGTLAHAYAILPPRPDGAVPCACPADFNCDNAANSQDFFDFLAAFFQSAADFNQDGATNSQDYFDFLNAFFAGC